MSSSISAPTAVSGSTFAFSSPAVFMAASGYSSLSSNNTSSNQSTRPTPELSFSSTSSFSSSAPASLSTVVHSGRLFKRQPLFNWAERFVILTASEFFWYKRGHSPLPVSFQHSAPLNSSSSPSPAPSPSPSPSSVLWGEERGHWLVADMAIRYASEKRTFILINTNMSASAHTIHAKSAEKDKEKEKERDIQHEIHLKASNDFDYLAWQHAFQQVIRIQEAKKFQRTGNTTENAKNKDNGMERDKAVQKDQEPMLQQLHKVGGNGEQIHQNSADLYGILPDHQRRNSAPHGPSLTPTIRGSTTRFRPLSQPTYTPPPVSFPSRLSPVQISIRDAVKKEGDGMKQKVMGNGMVEKTGEDNEEMIKSENISVSKNFALNSSDSALNRNPPSLYLLSVLLPPSLSASILPGFHSSLFPLLSSTSSSPSLPVASEFVIHRPLSAAPSSSSESSSLFSPFSFLVPTFLFSSSSFRFTLTDGSLLHFPLSHLLTDSMLDKSEGEIVVSEAGSEVEILLHWKTNSKKIIKSARKISASVSMCFWLAILLFTSVLYSLSSFTGFAVISAASALALFTAVLCSVFLLFTAVQNFLWRDAVYSETAIITVKAIQMKKSSPVDLIVKRKSVSRKPRKLRSNSSKRC